MKSFFKKAILNILILATITKFTLTTEETPRPQTNNLNKNNKNPTKVTQDLGLTTTPITIQTQPPPRNLKDRKTATLGQKPKSPNRSPRHLEDEASKPSFSDMLDMRRSNEEYQRQLKTYLKKFRNEQKAIAKRFEETFDNLLIDIEKKNKKEFMTHVGDVASAMAVKNKKNLKIYNQFNRLKMKMKNAWMIPP